MGDRGPRENNGERPRVPFTGSPPHRSGVLNSAHEAVCLLRNLSRRRMTRRTKWEGVAIYGHLVLCRPGGEAHGRGDARYFLAPGLWHWGPTFRPCTRDVFCPLADPHRAHTPRIPVDS